MIKKLRTFGRENCSWKGKPLFKGNSHAAFPFFFLESALEPHGPAPARPVPKMGLGEIEPRVEPARAFCGHERPEPTSIFAIIRST